MEDSLGWMRAARCDPHDDDARPGGHPAAVWPRGVEKAVGGAPVDDSWLTAPGPPTAPRPTARCRSARTPAAGTAPAALRRAPRPRGRAPRSRTAASG